MFLPTVFDKLLIFWDTTAFQTEASGRRQESFRDRAGRYVARVTRKEDNFFILFPSCVIF